MSGHKRGCSGREYTCTCGHDDTITDTIEAQAAEIAEYRRQHCSAVEIARPLLDALEAQAAEIKRLKNILRDCDPESMSWLDARDAALGETE